MEDPLTLCNSASLCRSPVASAFEDPRYSGGTKRLLNGPSVRSMAHVLRGDIFQNELQVETVLHVFLFCFFFLLFNRLLGCALRDLASGMSRLLCRSILEKCMQQQVRFRQITGIKLKCGRLRHIFSLMFGSKERYVMFSLLGFRKKQILLFCSTWRRNYFAYLPLLKEEFTLHLFFVKCPYFHEFLENYCFHVHACPSVLKLPPADCQLNLDWLKLDLLCDI